MEKIYKIKFRDDKRFKKYLYLEFDKLFNEYYKDYALIFRNYIQKDYIVLDMEFWHDYGFKSEYVATFKVFTPIKPKDKWI